MKTLQETIGQVLLEKIIKEQNKTAEVSEEYIQKIVLRTLAELQDNIKNSKNEREENFYKNRFDVQLKDFAVASEMSEKEIKKLLKDYLKKKED